LENPAVVLNMGSFPITAMNAYDQRNGTFHFVPVPTRCFSISSFFWRSLWESPHDINKVEVHKLLNMK
jgi:hypothetical protein